MSHKPLHKQQQLAVRWLYSAAGQIFVRAEQRAIDRLLRPVFGVHLLQLGILQQTELFKASQINHCFALAPRATAGGVYAALSDYAELPLEQDSVDCLLIHHVLEFAQDPHAILREAARVVRPEGVIVVVLFNPWSMLGLQQKLFGRWQKKTWTMASPGSSKLSDWLQLLDFSVDSVEHCWHLPIIHRPSLAEKMLKFERPLHRLTRPFGASAVVCAKKRSSTFTPVRRRWSSLAPGLGVPIMRPSTRAARETTRND